MSNEDPFLDFVIQKAESIGKLFILDSGEGNGFVDDTTGWYIEDLSGWLINPSEKDKFIKSRENSTAYDDFSDNYVFAKCSKSNNDNLEIQFRKY